MPKEKETKPKPDFKAGCHRQPIRLKKLEKFECGICEKEQNERPYWSRVEGLALDPHQWLKICSRCIERVNYLDWEPDYEFE